ncbi:MAG: transposase [Candidatus Moraniibacteriota bacterium]
MSTRKTPLVTGEIYHVYNRGVDKRSIVGDEFDSERFLKSMVAFNTGCPVLSLRNAELIYSGSTPVDPLVEVIAYCLNPNHFHLILRQTVDGGVSEFMKRLSGGYTWYFNNKYERSGSLFQGRYKSVHVDTNEYLLQLSVYVTLNFRAHDYESSIDMNLIRSSWDEYSRKIKRPFCKKDEILGQFRNKKEYVRFAEQTIIGIRGRKVLGQELGSIE